MKNPVIASIGEILWDVFEDGGKSLGGAPLNCLYHAVRHRAAGYFISAVGRDNFGRAIYENLPQNGIKYFIQDNAYPTGVVDVRLENGQPSYTIRGNVAWDYISYNEDLTAIAKNIDAVVFGTLASRSPAGRSSVEKFLNSLSINVTKFFDLNLRHPYYSVELIEKFLGYADILKLNDDELSLVCQMLRLPEAEDEACRALIEKYSLRMIALTCGGDYSAVYSLTVKSFIKTPRVEIVDTVGAGDAFAGVFLYNILAGNDMASSHQKAVDAAAYVCTKRGAMPAYPTLP